MPAFCRKYRLSSLILTGLLFAAGAFTTEAAALNRMEDLSTRRYYSMGVSIEDRMVAEFHDINDATLGWGHELKYREAYPSIPVHPVVTGPGVPGEKRERKVVGRELRWIESVWVD